LEYNETLKLLVDTHDPFWRVSTYRI